MLQAREDSILFSCSHPACRGWTVPEINSHHTQSHIHRLSLEQHDFMMMYGSAGLLSEFQSSNPVQKRLYQCHISVVTYTCISVSSQAGAARKRQGRMTIWGSWTRRCSCTWITAAAMAMAARSCKSKGVVSVYACMHFVVLWRPTDRNSTAVAVFLHA